MSDIPRHTMETLLISCDHAGYALKEHLKTAIAELPWRDLGPNSDASVDYPDYADRLVKEMSWPQTVGVLICGSGQGICMRANRYKQIRAALCWTEEVARLARSHNDANVLCLPGRSLDFELCERILITFLDTPFEGGRHAERVKKLGL